MIRTIITICCFLMTYTLSFGQNSRDMIKVGAGYNLITLEDVFVPAYYVEYSRVFYDPISIGVSAGYSKAEGIELVFEDRDLETLHFDFNVYYSFTPEHPVHDIRPGFMLSARSYKTDWRNRDTGASDTERFFKPGLGFVLNYDAHIGKLFLVGVKASIAAYDKNNSVFLIGGHLGLQF